MLLDNPSAYSFLLLRSLLLSPAYLLSLSALEV